MKMICSDVELSNVAPPTGRFLSKSFANMAGTCAYKLFIPSGSELEARPLIVMLHGCNQSADDFAAGTRMNFAAEELSCYVAFPEQNDEANSSRCWNWFQSGHQARSHGEPSIIAGIAKQIIGDYAINPGRVYVAGLSAGGAAAAVVAQAYPDVFAALGVHSGLPCGVARESFSAFAAMQGYAMFPPTPCNAIPTIVFHGDQDRSVHARNGADVANGAAGGESYEREVERWAAVPAGRGYSRSIHRELGGKQMIEDWVIHGLGHAWSGGSTAGSYTDPLGPDASKEMIRFFLEHELDHQGSEPKVIAVGPLLPPTLPAEVEVPRELSARRRHAVTSRPVPRGRAKERLVSSADAKNDVRP
ncbi:MAG: extracellular catalytic domain type 1 short-chain-length polyhydroxyalkanoate depolymerase [Candidatus Binatia bacterium]